MFSERHSAFDAMGRMQFANTRVSEENVAELKKVVGWIAHRKWHYPDEGFFYDLVLRLLRCEGFDLDECLGVRAGGMDYYLTTDLDRDFFEKTAIEMRLYESHPHTPAEDIARSLARRAASGATRIIVITEGKKNHHKWLNEGRKLSLMVEPRTKFDIFRWIDSFTSNDVELKNELIQIVYDLSKKIIEMIAKDERTLDHVEWRDLERALAECFRGNGFEVHLTAGSKDGGKDIILRVKSGEIYKYYNIELKHWRSGKKVAADTVERFISVNVRENTAGGVLISTSGFGEPVFQVLTKIKKSSVVLAGKTEVVRLCRSYVRHEGGVWSCDRRRYSACESTNGARSCDVDAPTCSRRSHINREVVGVVRR